jgi:hypothetical protein
MKKRGRDQARHKSRAGAVTTNNTIQHQMLGEFGSVDNFVKNMRRLAELFRELDELKALRFDADALYAKLDLAEPKTNAALRDLYSQDDLTYYAEEHEEFWKTKRGEVLPELISDERAEEIEKIFKVLVQKKRGFKKDYRAVLAGHLMAQSHLLAQTEAPVGENSLWELMFNATLKENHRELPEPVEPTPSEATEPAAEPAPEAATPTAGE